MADVEYKVREARPNDKADVLRIHENVYDGNDYLQDYYDHWMVSSGYTSYVYEQEGMVIGFLATNIVDGGETAMDRAGRVRPKHAGAGVYRSLLAEVESIHRKHGQIQRHVLATASKQSESFLRKHTHITSRALYGFKFPIETYKEPENASESLSSVQQVPDSLPPEFLQAPYAKYLFPDDRVVVSWRPFRLLEANIPLIKDKDTVFTSNVQHKDATFSGMLMAGTIYKTANGSICCDVDVYGSDFSSFQYHLEHHMRRVRAKGIQSVTLRIFTDTQISSTVMETLFHKLGLAGSETNLQVDIYERSIGSENKSKETQ